MAAPQHGLTAESIRHAHAALLRHKDLQLDFPRYDLPQTPAWMIAFNHWLERLAPVWRVLWWVICGVALVALVFFAGRWLWRLRRPERLKVQDMRTALEEWRPTATQARALLADADELAHEGKYGEAVHLLLLRSIEDLDQFRPRVVQRSYTAREIERLGVMPMTVRAAFAGIMDVVERSLFGGHEVTLADYEHCRDEYKRFAFPEAWRSG